MSSASSNPARLTPLIGVRKSLNTIMFMIKLKIDQHADQTQSFAHHGPITVLLIIFYLTLFNIVNIYYI